MTLASVPRPARATSKEMIELQTQVQQLLDMVQRLQSTLDTRLGVLQHLAEQTADDANRVTATVNALQQKINAQMDKTLQEMQTQLQNIQTPASTTVPGSQPSAGGMAPGQAVNQTPPLQETFQAGVRDYNAAKYDVASGEFQDVLHYYPLDDLAGTAQFYLGEIAYRQQNYADAVTAYNAVLEGFPGSAKAPAAQLRKGLALLQMNRKTAGVQELRALIQRHPQTPEAAQARQKLANLGIRAR